MVARPDGVTVVVFGGRHRLSGDDPKVPNNGEVIYSRDNGKTWVKPAPGRGFKCDPKSYYPSACVLEDGSIFMVGQREGFKNRFGPHGSEVTSVRFRIKKPEGGKAWSFCLSAYGLDRGQAGPFQHPIPFAGSHAGPFRPGKAGLQESPGLAIR